MSSWTMGCGDGMPLRLPRQAHEDWGVEDPAGKDLDAVRRIRDDIDGRVRRLASELLGDG